MQKNAHVLFILITSFFIEGVQVAISQNLVSNPDFELYSALPTNNGQLPLAINWDDIVQSSDYMNTSYSGWSPQIGGAYSGNGYAGFASYGDATGSSEAIGQNIAASPIKADTNYTIGFYAKRTSGGSYNQYCGGVAVYGFSAPPGTSFLAEHVSNLPGAHLLWTSNMVSDSTWKYYTGCFQSSIQINYIVFSVEKVPNCGQYIYIDKIAVLNNGCDSALANIPTNIPDDFLEMPNTFSPNNDGRNDLFYPIRMTGIDHATLEIYNRWGEKLFETTDLAKGWNGKRNNEDCSNGTYFWIVKYSATNKKSKTLKGFLTLLK